MGELEGIGRIAGPLAGSNVGQALLGVIDAAVIGHLGTLELGALGLGTTLFFTVSIPVTGLLLGYEPLIAQAVGAGESRRARDLARSAVALCLLVSLPMALAGAAAATLLEHAGIPNATATAVRSYLYIRLLGLPAHLVFVALRSYAQATGRADEVLRAVLASNLVHLPLVIALVHGDLALAALGLPPAGLPALGLRGAAFAGVVSTAVSVLFLGVATASSPSASEPRASARGMHRGAFGIGAPIALSMLAEQGVFALVNLLVGGLDPNALAAHEVAMTYAGGVFVVPMAIGAAAAVRVGSAVGRQEAATAVHAGRIATAASAAFMLLAAAVFAGAPGMLAALLSDDPGVVRAAEPLLRVAALFAVFDGVQVTLAGALRGAGDTRVACLANLGAHYGLGLPLGVVLAIPCGLGAVGLWWGLSLGLAVVAGVLAWRCRVVGASLSGRRLLPVSRLGGCLGAGER